MSDDLPLTDLIFGEGHCRRCGEQKRLAMVAFQQGGAVGRIDDITGQFIPFPRVGFCFECAKAKADAGDFRQENR